MEYEELLEKLEAYLAGEVPLEEARNLEEEVNQNPLLAMAHGLYQLQPIAGEQLAQSIAPMEREAQGSPRFPRLWLLSLLAGSVIIGTQGAQEKQKKTTGEAAQSNEHTPPGAAG